MQHARNEKRYIDGSNAQTEFYYDKNGNLIADFDRKICSIQYNVLSLPDTIQFSNGNQIVHVYDASGKRLQTTYYTRKVALVEPATSTLPGTVTNNTQLYTITSQTDVGNKRYKRYGTSGSWQLDYVFNPVGYLRCYAPGEHYPFYYIKDHIGNVRETYITPIPGEKYCEQRMQYYPSGLPWNQNSGASEQPFKYNGKEFIEMSGLDEYDSEARWYYPAIMRTTTMDPLCEKYYSTSPYAWCGNNPVNYVDPDGRDWYQSEDGSATFWRDSHDASVDVAGEIYRNIGESYTCQVGNATFCYSQNELESISYSTSTTFMAQTDNTGCKRTCNKMVESSGMKPELGRSGEILMANHDENGVVTNATNNYHQGLYRLDQYLFSGAPCIIGVDYKSQQQHNLASEGGDGMTDHFVTIVGMVINMRDGSTNYFFYDPGSSKRGSSPNNIISMDGCLLKGRTAAKNTPFIVTTIRKNK